MNRKNKDYKPQDEFAADLARKKAVARTIAQQIYALTVRDDVDIDLLIDALHRGLFSTKEAAEALGVSPRAFLRLRRKHGLQPVARPWVSKALHLRRYMYSAEQLQKIPPEEVDVAKRHALIGQRVARAKQRRSPRAAKRTVGQVA